MATLADVFRELNALKTEGLVREYAIGGATAVLFYAEPARTYDVDVFVSLQPSEGSPLVSLSPIYDWARARGFSLDAVDPRPGPNCVKVCQRTVELIGNAQFARRARNSRDVGG